MNMQKLPDAVPLRAALRAARTQGLRADADLERVMAVSLTRVRKVQS